MWSSNEDTWEVGGDSVRDLTGPPPSGWFFGRRRKNQEYMERDLCKKNEVVMDVVQSWHPMVHTGRHQGFTVHRRRIVVQGSPTYPPVSIIVRNDIVCSVNVYRDKTLHVTSDGMYTHLQGNESPRQPPLHCRRWQVFVPDQYGTNKTETKDSWRAYR